MSFRRPGCSSREDSGGLLDRGRNNMCGRGSQRGILTGTVPCALNQPFGETTALLSFPNPAAAPERIPEASSTRGPIDVCGVGSRRGILTGTVPCALNSALRGDHCPAVSSAPGDLWGLTLTLNLARTGTLHQNLSLPGNLPLHLSCLVAWALSSGLTGDHETGFALALATSQDRT